MKKLEKPKFFTIPIWGNISLVLGIIAVFSFSTKLSDIVILIIILILLGIFFCINLTKYIINWHNLYEDYLIFFHRFTELDNRYNTRIEEIKDKNILIEEYEDFIRKLDIFILSALNQNSPKEVQQILNLQQLLYVSNEHILKLKGEFENGRSL